MNKLETKIKNLQKDIADAGAKKELAQEELKNQRKQLKKMGINPHNLNIEIENLGKEITKLSKQLEKELENAEAIVTQN